MSDLTARKQAALNKLVDKSFSSSDEPVRTDDVQWCEDIKALSWYTRLCYDLNELLRFKDLVKAENISLEGSNDDEMLVWYDGVTFPWEL